MSRPLTRRSVLAASAGLAAAPFVKAYRPQEPRDKVRLAVIGLANRGEANWSQFVNEEVVALCDVDPKHAEKARAKFPGARFYTDMRKLFDEQHGAVDGVVVSTPDHTHAWPVVRALKLGKHVYCEKPLARTVGEVRAVRTAAGASRGVTQMGTQLHAGDNYRRVVEVVRSGALGDVRGVSVWLSSGPPRMRKAAAAPAPGFDLDVWRGPVADDYFAAEPADGESKRAWPHFHWRYWWEYGGGQLGDFGCHYLDLPFWALGLTAPAQVRLDRSVGPPPDPGLNTVPAALRVEYGFAAPKPVTVQWEHGVPGPLVDGIRRRFAGFPNGVLFAGADRYLLADYGKYKLYPKAFADGFRPPEPSIAKSAGHHQEWLGAIRGTDTALCEFGYAADLTETVLLGNVAHRLGGGTFEWDAAKGWFVGRPEADDLLHPPVRKGWELA
jgi:predicted dehydrogenase